MKYHGYPVFAMYSEGDWRGATLGNCLLFARKFSLFYCTLPHGTRHCSSSVEVRQTTRARATWQQLKLKEQELVSACLLQRGRSPRTNPPCGHP